MQQEGPGAFIEITTLSDLTKKDNVNLTILMKDIYNHGAVVFVVAIARGSYLAGRCHCL